MPRLTDTGIAAGLAAILVFGALVGWGAGRAFERAANAWRRFRWHFSMSISSFRYARWAALDAISTVLLAIAVLAAAGATVWMVWK